MKKFKFTETFENEDFKFWFENPINPLIKYKIKVNFSSLEEAQSKLKKLIKKWEKELLSYKRYRDQRSEIFPEAVLGATFVLKHKNIEWAYDSKNNRWEIRKVNRTYL